MDLKEFTQRGLHYWLIILVGSALSLINSWIGLIPFVICSWLLILAVDQAGQRGRGIQLRVTMVWFPSVIAIALHFVTFGKYWYVMAYPILFSSWVLLNAMYLKKLDKVAIYNKYRMDRMD